MRIILPFLLALLAACGEQPSQEEDTSGREAQAGASTPQPKRLAAIPTRFHGCWELDETAEFDWEPGIGAKALGYSSKLTITASEMRQDFGWPDSTFTASIEKLDYALFERDGRVRLQIDREQSDGSSDIKGFGLAEEDGRTFLYPGGDATVVLYPYRRCGSEPSTRSPQTVEYLPERFVGSWVYVDESCSGASPSRLEIAENRVTIPSHGPDKSKASGEIGSITLYPEGGAMFVFGPDIGDDLAGLNYWMTVEGDLLHSNFVGNGVNRSDPPRKRCPQ